ncbi:glycosyltransferase family 4 protein [Piscinibacter sp.]|uniref:glycosyltransferase family 4 protein n=1 Tax=Piscinibacter sp. TaxID=1903157 RepID=UPI002BB5D03A|nr:glycosyltransferase family 4 protein [Albitalea sp.]HUG23773.1 glycosyltransferase family 4 protein [Albitalea sp.]
MAGVDVAGWRIAWSVFRLSHQRRGKCEQHAQHHVFVEHLCPPRGDSRRMRPGAGREVPLAGSRQLRRRVGGCRRLTRSLRHSHTQVTLTHSVFMRPKILNCSQNTNPAWRWLEGKVAADFEYVDMQPRNWLEARLRKPYLARYRAAAEAARKSRSADLLVTHSPAMTTWTEAFRRAPGVPHLAFSFNFTKLPTGAMLKLMRSVLPRVDRFVVFSTMERRLYAETFGIDPNRIDVVYWGVRPPEVGDNPPIVEGDYLCAVGGEGRDYRLLVDALRRLPHIPAVVVARPHNLAGLDVPGNVTVRTNIPRSEVHGIISRSRFMVLPLLHTKVPCGHVTIVSAMYLSKAIITSASDGITDYVFEGKTGLMVPPGDVTALAERIRELWEDPARSERLGAAGQAFAHRHCSEAATIDYVNRYLGSISPNYDNLVEGERGVA